MTFKQKIYDHYLNRVNEKVKLLQNVLADLKDSSSNETKSTAGDKHETALAMLQMEQKNIQSQLQEALLQKHGLEKIDPVITGSIITNGSLVKTNRGYFFISIALGKAVVDAEDIMAISPYSPLGNKLQALGIGAIIEMNSYVYIIERIE